MADASVKGINVKFGADTVGFDDGIKGINRAIKVTKNEVTNLNKQLKLDSGNTDLLKQKFTAVTRQIDLSKQRLEMYQKELDGLDDSDIGGAEWSKLKVQIQNAETEIKQLTNEAQKTEKAIDDISNKKVDVDAQSAEDDIKDLTSEAKKSDKAIDGISDNKVTSDTTQAQKSLEDLKKKAEDTAQKLDKIGEGFVSAGKKASILSAAIVAGFGVGVVKASDLQEAINAAENQFGDFSDEMLKFTAQAPNIFGETQAGALEYASQLKRIGMSNEQIMEVMQRTSDVASEQNQSFEDVGATMISVYNGSTEAGERYGIQTKANQLAQYAFEKGMTSSIDEANKLVSSMTTAEKQALIYEKIMYDTAASQGDFANNAGTWAIELKKLQANISELVREIGEALLPILEPILSKISNLAQSFRGLSDSQKQVIVTIGLVIAAIGPLLLIIGNVFIWMGKLTLAASTLGISLGALLAPIAATIAIVAALVAGFTYAFNNSETFRNAIDKLFASVKALTDDVLSALVDFYNQHLAPMFKVLGALLEDVVIDTFNHLANIVNDVVMPIINELWRFIKEYIIPIFARAVDTITTTLVPAFQKIWDIISTYVLPILTKIWAWIAENIMPIFTSLAGLLTGLVGGAFNTVFSIVSTLVSIIASLFGWIGDLYEKFKDTAAFQVITAAFQGVKDLIEGIIGGIQSAISWVGNLGSKISDSIGGFMSWLNPFDSGGFSFDSGGYGDVVLNASFNIQTDGTIGNGDMRRMARQLADMVDEELGRRR